MEPCSWVLRNFVRIMAMLLFVVGILVNYDIVVGNDQKAGGTGYEKDAAYLWTRPWLFLSLSINRMVQVRRYSIGVTYLEKPRNA